MKYLLTQLLIICSLAAAAQSVQGTAKEKKPRKFSIGIQFQFPEYTNGDITKLNRFLADYHYPKASYWPLALGPGLIFIIHKFNVTISYSSNSPTEKKYGDSATVKMKGFFFNLGLSYNLVELNRFTIYPYAGYESAGLTYGFKVNRSYSLVNYLQSDFLNKNFTFSRSYANLGAGVEYGKFRFVGLRAGVLLPLGNGHCTAEETVINKNIALAEYKYYITLYFFIKGTTSAK